MELIFTNDDAGAARGPEAVARFETVAAWLEGRGLRATWFWVPKAAGRTGDADPDWIPALRAARDRGHDIQLHGLTHGSCLEFGLPQEVTRIANPRPFEEYAANREFWERQHRPASLSARVGEGVGFYERAFGCRPLVFRSPCFGMCAGAYQALAENGIRWSSSRGINPLATAYTLLGDPSLRRWAPDVPCRPYPEEAGVRECPCIEDLTIFGVPPGQIEERLDLFRSELGHIMAEAGPDGVLILGTHYQSMMKTWPQTRPLFDRLLDWLFAKGVGRCVTFAQHVYEVASPIPRTSPVSISPIRPASQGDTAQ